MSSNVVLSLLKEVRKQKGVTQTELARSLEVDVSVIENAELNKPIPQSLATKIASALNIDTYHFLVNELVTNKENNTTSPTNTVEKQALGAVISVLLGFILFAGLDVEYTSSLAIAFAFIPIVMIANFPSGDENKPGKVPSLKFWFLLGIGFFFSTLFAPIFSSLSIAFSFGTTDSQANALMVYTLIPGVDTILNKQNDLMYPIWIASGVLSLISLGILHYMMYKARASNLFLGKFPDVFLYSVVSLLLLSWLTKGGVEAYQMEEFALLSILGIWGVLYLALVKIFKINGKKKKEVAAGFALSLFPILLVSLLFSLLLAYYELRSALVTNSEIRISYCESVSNDDKLCWDAELLKKHDIDVSLPLVTILNSRNGVLLQFSSVLSQLRIPKPDALEKKPLPLHVIRFIADSYYNVLLANEENGTLEYFLTQQSKERDSFDFKELNERIEWVILAKSEIEEFVENFPTASDAVKKDPYLLTIYKSAKGDWGAIDVSDTKVYTLGMISIYYEGVVGDITFDMIEESYKIHQEELPINKLLQ